MTQATDASFPTSWPGASGPLPRFGRDQPDPTRLQSALTAGDVAAWHTDLRTRERWWSPQMFDAHGVAVTDPIPADYIQLVVEEDRERVRQAFAQLVGEGSHRVQYRVRWPDGSVHWLEGAGRSVADAAGQVLAISGVCSRIDERKREEADLRFLATASAEFARSVDYEETLRKVATLAVPQFADWCAVDMLDEGGELRRVAVAHVDPAMVQVAQDLHRRYPPDPAAAMGTWNVLKTGAPELVARIPDELVGEGARDAEHARMLRSLKLHSYMAVPIVGPDGVLGVISFVSSESLREYGPRDLALAVDLAARGAAAVHNAMLFQALRRSERRHAFLLQLTDVLRRAEPIPQVLRRVSEMLGQHFGVDRVGYGHVDEHLDSIEYDVCWAREGTAPLLGTFPASAFGQKVIDRLRGGDTVAMADVRDNPLTADEAALKTSAEVDTRAVLVVPLSKAGRLRTIVYLNQGPAREWQPGEISLMEEVAERTRELIERGRTEDALRRSEAGWRGLFERMAEGFFVAEAIRDAHGRMSDFRFLEVNPAFEKLTGVPPASAVGAAVSDVIPGVPQGLIDTYARVVDTGNPEEFEVLVPVLQDRWYEARARRIAPERFSVLFLEITERKLAQLEAARTAERYRTLFASIDEGFCILEVLFEAGQPVDYRFLEVNPAFERQSGLTNAAGRTIRELVPDIEADYIETYGRVAVGREPIRFESRAEALGRWFDAFAFPVGEPHEHRVGLLFTDITERKSAQQALIEREFQLREADARKDEFLATLAHELRNPLAPLRNGLAILSHADAHSHAAVRARALMDRQLTHVVRLVDDLLDVSRVSRGKVELKKEPVLLQSLVDAALETSRPALDAAGHTLALDLPTQPLTLAADPVRMAQVLSNLLNNAAKYTPPGGHVGLSARWADTGRIRIEITDDGVGIPQDMLAKVFDLFTQVGSAIDRSQGGLGIGLSLAKGLVELHGGTIAARSPGPGLGSTFCVELPVVRGAEAAPSPERAQPAPVPGAAGRRILVVDDNVDAAETLRMLLELDGHEVQVAHTGTAALQAAVAQHDVILLDIGLPDVNGYDVAARLRAMPALARTVLVALTGWGGERDRQRAREAGFDHHLTKPVTPEDLRTTLAAAGG